MATRFIKQATKQLNPVFAAQTQATQAQIPAIQQLYQSLTQGLEAQGAAERQNILEDASGRGVLRSSLPVDLQTALGQSLLQQRGQLGAQQARDIAGVQGSLADIGLERARSIYDLASSLQGGDLEERRFKFQKQQTLREFNLDKQLALLRASGGSGGSGGGGGGYGGGLVGTFIQKKDGGYDFYDPSGKRLKADEYATLNNISLAEALAGSKNPGDRALVEDIAKGLTEAQLRKKYPHAFRK